MNGVPPTPDETQIVAEAYGVQSQSTQWILGTEVSPADPDRAIIEPWAASVTGEILDVGSGTGRWTGHLNALGFQVQGLEPSTSLLEVARTHYPSSVFHHGAIKDLDTLGTRWDGILAWYSLIHIHPNNMVDALTSLKNSLHEGGTLVASFFTGPKMEAIQHPIVTAYRWPLKDKVQLLQQVGFDVIVQHSNQASPHGYVIARLPK